MAKASKKPCDIDRNMCYWQFADLCLRFPGHKEERGCPDGELIRIPVFREHSSVPVEECARVQILTDNGSVHNPLHFVAKTKRARRLNDDGSPLLENDKEDLDG